MEGVLPHAHTILSRGKCPANCPGTEYWDRTWGVIRPLNLTCGHTRKNDAKQTTGPYYVLLPNADAPRPSTHDGVRDYEADVNYTGYHAKEDTYYKPAVYH